jgi:hypothetical protein
LFHDCIRICRCKLFYKLFVCHGLIGFGLG